jgi:hypothetical protein
VQNLVYLKDDNEHRSVTFFVAVTAKGGSVAFAGPYNYHVGCTNQTVKYTDSKFFVSSLALNVGDSTMSRYFFDPPSSSLSYCRIQTIEIVTENGETWKGDAKLLPSSACLNKLNCTRFDLNSTDLPDYFAFKVRTNFTGGMVHLSPFASITIA